MRNTLVFENDVYYSDNFQSSTVDAKWKVYNTSNNTGTATISSPVGANRHLVISNDNKNGGDTKVYIEPASAISAYKSYEWDIDMSDMQEDNGFYAYALFNIVANSAVASTYPETYISIYNHNLNGVIGYKLRFGIKRNGSTVTSTFISHTDIGQYPGRLKCKMIWHSNNDVDFYVTNYATNEYKDGDTWSSSFTLAPTTIKELRMCVMGDSINYPTASVLRVYNFWMKSDEIYRTDSTTTLLSSLGGIDSYSVVNSPINDMNFLKTNYKRALINRYRPSFVYNYSYISDEAALETIINGFNNYSRTYLQYNSVIEDIVRLKQVPFSYIKNKSFNPSCSLTFESQQVYNYPVIDYTPLTDTYFIAENIILYSGETLAGKITSDIESSRVFVWFGGTGELQVNYNGINYELLPNSSTSLPAVTGAVLMTFTAQEDTEIDNIIIGGA